MICPNCGSCNDNDAKKCKYCAFSLVASESENTPLAPQRMQPQQVPSAHETLLREVKEQGTLRHLFIAYLWIVTIAIGILASFLDKPWSGYIGLLGLALFICVVYIQIKVVLLDKCPVCSHKLIVKNAYTSIYLWLSTIVLIFLGSFLSPLLFLIALILIIVGVWWQIQQKITYKCSYCGFYQEMRSILKVWK